MYIIIVGCGRVGSQLAVILSEEKHDVVIIDKDQNSFRRLGETFNGLTMCGNGINPDFLKTAGIERADAVCVLTNGDNTNLITAQVAKKIFKVPKVFARVYDPKRAEIFSSVGVEIISGTVLIASMVRDKIMDAQFSSYLIESKELIVIKIEIKKHHIGKTVGELNITDEFSVITMLKKGKTILPQLSTKIEKEDVVFALVKMDKLEQVKKKLGIE